MKLPTSTQRLLTIIGCTLLVFWPITYIVLKEFFLSIGRLFGFLPESSAAGNQDSVGVALFYLVAIPASMFINLILGLAISVILKRSRNNDGSPFTWLIGFTIAGIIGITLFIIAAKITGVLH
jgi:hypothetical protein